MKNHYEVVKQDSLYKCREKATNHILRSYPDKVSAESMCEFWNNGGGFCGFTPAFICAEPYLPVIEGNEKCTFSVAD